MVPKTRMHKAHFEHNLKSLPKLVRLTPPGALTKKGNRHAQARK